LSRHLHTRNDQSTLERLKRLVSSRSGLALAAAELSEEAFVRVMLRKPLRRAVATLRGQQQPEFVVGCYNSGTTILRNMIAAHPEIASLPREGVRFARQLSNLQEGGHHMHWAEEWKKLATPANGATDAREAMLDWSPFWRRGAKVHIEKSVAHSARIPWLAAHFPNARFIGIHRNGYCVAEGLRRRSRPPDWLKAKTGLDHYPLKMSAQQWLDANSAMLEGLETVQHKMIVPFQRMVSDPVAVLEDAFSFAGVKPVPLFYDGTHVTINGTPFEIRNPDPASFTRLSNEDRLSLQAQQGGMMARLGYEPYLISTASI
jgi:Sulfotransferase family